MPSLFATQEPNQPCSDYCKNAATQTVKHADKILVVMFLLLTFSSLIGSAITCQWKAPTNTTDPSENTGTLDSTETDCVPTQASTITCYVAILGSIASATWAIYRTEKAKEAHKAIMKRFMKPIEMQPTRASLLDDSI